MYVYKAYNLGIHSQLPLPELIPTESPADVVLRLGKLTDSELQSSNGGDRFLGKVEGLGMFLVQGGCKIVIDPDPGVDESVLRPLILGPILSVLLRQRGLLVLHASSFADNGEAVAFVAESGWGKSTLVEAFHAKGYSILTDDVLGIQADSFAPTVIPSFPQVKLWPDAAASIGHTPQSLPLLHSQTAKLAHRLTHGFLQTPLTLKRIYVLAFGDRHEIIPLSPQDSFVELVRHSRAVSLLTARDFLSSHFRQCTSLVKNVPICRLSRQRSLAALPDLVKLIEEDLAATARHDDSRHSPTISALSHTSYKPYQVSKVLVGGYGQ